MEYVNSKKKTHKKREKSTILDIGIKLECVKEKDYNRIQS